MRNLACSCTQHLPMSLSHVISLVISLRGTALVIRFIVNRNYHIVLVGWLLVMWRLFSIIRVTSFIRARMLHSSSWDRSPSMNRRVIVMSC